MHRRITLYVNHWLSHDPVRRNEINQCLMSNVRNPHINQIIILSQSTIVDRPEMDGYGEKIKWIPVNCAAMPYERPTFSLFFEHVNRIVASPYDISIVANSDIEFDDSLFRLQGVNLEHYALALARWEPQQDGTLHFTDCDYSQDAWIFQGRIRPLKDIDFPMGVYDCDQRLAWELRESGYCVVNPGRDIRCIHRHHSHVRSPGEPIRGRKGTVCPSKLAECRLTKPVPSRCGVISYSLFGDRADYTIGAVRNAQIAKHLYPGWTVRVYHDSTVPALVIEELNDLNVELVKMLDSVGTQGMFWRLLVADEVGYERWMIRDADSRLNYRERRAVDDWIESGLPFHVLRDHPLHQRPIMGIGFGGRRATLNSVAEMMSRWTYSGAYHDDENFMEEILWPVVKHSALIHSPYGGAGERITDFPTDRVMERFVGEKCREDEHWEH